VANETRPGRSRLWDEYEELRGPDLPSLAAPGIGTPENYRKLAMEFQNAGIDQVIFLQQGGKNRHEHICESLEYFARDVLPSFQEDREAREAAKMEELAPYLEAAMARKVRMPELTDDEIPIVPPSQEREAFYVRAPADES